MRILFGAMFVVLALTACTDADTSEGQSDAPAKPTESDENAPEDDAVIDSCAPQAATKWHEAVGTITNHSSKPSDYFVTVAFEGPDGAQLATGSGAAQNVNPDQTAAFTASAVKELAAGTTCRVAEVNRLAS